MNLKLSLLTVAIISTLGIASSSVAWSEEADLKSKTSTVEDETQSAEQKEHDSEVTKGHDDKGNEVDFSVMSDEQKLAFCNDSNGKYRYKNGKIYIKVKVHLIKSVAEAKAIKNTGKVIVATTEEDAQKESSQLEKTHGEGVVIFATNMDEAIQIALALIEDDSISAAKIVAALTAAYPDAANEIVSAILMAEIEKGASVKEIIAIIENPQTVQSNLQALIALTAFMSSEQASAIAGVLIEQNPEQMISIVSQIITNNVTAAIAVTQAAIDIAPNLAAAIKTAAIAAIEAANSTVAQGVIDAINGLPVSPS